MVNTVIDRIKLCTDKVLPLISAICDRIGLVEIIDEHIGTTQNERILSTGNAVKAIAMNIVAGREPAYRLEEFYKYTDTEKMFGAGIKAEHITDDTIARALDEMYEIGPKKAMTEAAMTIIREYNIPVRSIHADTTSKSVYGEYVSKDEAYEDAVDITYGHSKDHRPDLKQILFGLGTTKDRIIVVGNVCDGNTDDKTWNKDILKDLRESMKKYGLRDFIYVADSQAVTEGMLKELAGDNDNPAVDFVSRLPGNFSIEKELKQKALESLDNWEEIGSISDKPGSAEYKVKSYMAELYGRTYRFIVCHSSQLSTQKENTLKRATKSEQETVLKKISEFEKIEFYCEKDAMKALKRFEEEVSLQFHTFIGKVEAVEKTVKRNVRGRPKRGDEIPKVTVYTAKINLYKDDERIKEYRDRESLFVLVTSVLDNRKMTDAQILSEYKEQTSVETSFKVLKDPCFIDELFYKKPHRVESLAYIMIIALMLLTLLERTVRESLKEETERVMVSGKRRTLTPTGWSIIEAFENVQVIMINENGNWVRHCQLDENLKRLIVLAGFTPDIYIYGYKKV